MAPPAFAAPGFLGTTTRPTLLSTSTPLRIPTPTNPHQPHHPPARMTQTPPASSRRTFLQTALLSTAAVSLSLAASPPPPTHAAKSSLTGVYATDAATVLTDMKAACELTRGAPGMSETVGRTRKEMIDFVALYRRNAKVSGSPSFSTLYTAINTLSGHYASYGNAYPVPEKRKKRLSQQFNEIDRALQRGR